jgi:1-acyl-sn-glycerol-3-phosphate acyltransferase
MKKKKIESPSLGYEILKTFLTFLFPKFFREIEVRGMENIPEIEPIIFAGNHQCGLIDPLAVILFQKDPVVYMARADIFKNKLSAILLQYIKVTAIYRIRDGYENLTRNEKQLQVAVDVLRDRKRLGVMPEGNQGEQHKLRPLVKGLFRIAYSAEVLLENKAHVKIIPIGIDHSQYLRAGGDLVVTYGKPIEVSDYLPVYLENQATGLNVLKEKLAQEISPLMHDIRSTDYERTYELCCYGVPAYLEHQAENGVCMHAKTMAGLRFDARIALGKLFDNLEKENPEKMEALGQCCSRLKKLPGSPNEVTEWMEGGDTLIRSVSLALAGLLIIPGLLLNFPAWLLYRTIVSRVKDQQMHNTFAIAIGLFFNLLFYPIVTILLGSILGIGFLKGLVLFLLVATLGLVSERGRQYLRTSWKRLPFGFGKRKVLVSECKSDYQELKQRIKDLL